MISTILGIALLALLLYDVFFTVFHPQGEGGPVHKRQNRAVWWVFRQVGGRIEDEQRRGRVLAIAGPMLAVLTLLLWALLLIVSFALIYYTRIPALVVTTGSLQLDWVAALYYSGYLASTLGMGDIVPNTPGLRILAVAESTGGFALVSVSVSYLISVYREQGTATTLALGLNEYFHDRESELAAPGDQRQVDAVMRQAERFTDVILHLLQAYSQYPILLFFRPRDRDSSLVVQIGQLFEFIEAAETRGESEAAELLGHPSYPPLRRALRRYLETVEKQLFSSGDDRKASGLEASQQRHERLLRFMGYS